MRRPLAAFAATLALLGPVTLVRAEAAGDRPVHINWTPTAAELTATCSARLEKTKAAYASVLRQRSARTFATTMLPLENADADTNDVLNPLQFLAFVATDPAVRKAAFACQDQTSAVYTRVQADPQLYAALVAVQKSGTAKTVPDRKLLDNALRAVRRTGAGLNPTQRAQFIALNDRLSTLSTQFSQNLNNDATTIVMTKAESAGLPDDFIAKLKADAAGNFIVPVNESTVTPVMQNVRSGDVRKRYSLAYNSRGGEANLAVLKEAVDLRAQIAHLMGYPNWASFVISDRMAKSPQRVQAFLDDLNVKLRPRAQQDVATLAALKAKDLGTPTATLNSWDFAYYDNLLRKTQYNVDPVAISRYFPVQHTVDSILGIYQELLGVRFTRMPNANAWASEVTRFSVADATSGAYLGEFYLDLYPRPGKFSHFANWALLQNRRLPDGTNQAKVAAIVGNWSEPAPGKPALLTHDEVETFFHEFGHNMAALLGRAPYEGLGDYKRDFVEAPSQMLENWVWQPSILKRISQSVDNGQPMPDDLIAKLVATRHVDEAYATVNQVRYAAYDLALHTASNGVDPMTTYDAVNKTYAILDPSATRGTWPGTFGHLFGYDAGYYGYEWSKVYAQDMFTAFKTGGLVNPQVGLRYRADILAPAGEFDADKEVKDFLGRPMNPTAFYTDLGVAPTTAGK